MSLSCKSLAQRYVRESGQAIPSAQAPLTERQDWLLREKWGCIIPGQSTPTFDQSTCKSALDVKNINVEHKPFLNYLDQQGFVAWVNERGLKCINRVTGLFFGLNTATGVVNEPGPSTTPPPSECWGACLNVTDTSDVCFECVKQQLMKNPSLCPDVDLSKPENENLIDDAVACHACLGVQGTGANDEDTVNRYYQCVNAEYNPGLTATEIVAIIMATSFVVVVIVVLSVWYGYLRPKHIKEQKLMNRLHTAQGLGTITTQLSASAPATSSATAPSSVPGF